MLFCIKVNQMLLFLRRIIIHTIFVDRLDIFQRFLKVFLSLLVLVHMFHQQVSYDQSILFYHRKLSNLNKQLLNLFCFQNHCGINLILNLLILYQISYDKLFIGLLLCCLPYELNLYLSKTFLF